MNSACVACFFCLLGECDVLSSLRSWVKNKQKYLSAQIQRSFKLEVQVDPNYHQQLIGPKGAVITKIRQDHNVNVQFPARGAENQGMIMIIGYEEDTHHAKDDILNIVKKLVRDLLQMYFYFLFVSVCYNNPSYIKKNKLVVLCFELKLKYCKLWNNQFWIEMLRILEYLN